MFLVIKNGYKYLNKQSLTSSGCIYEKQNSLKDIFLLILLIVSFFKNCLSSFKSKNSRKKLSFKLGAFVQTSHPALGKLRQGTGS